MILLARTLFFCFLLGSPYFASAAEQVRLPSLKLLNGTEYTNIVVLEKLPDGIKISHENGVAKIKAEQLPENVVKLLGGFDRDAIEQFRTAEAVVNKMQAVDEQKRLEAEKQDAAIWEPYTSQIATLRQNVPSGQEVYFQQLKDTLAALQTTCRPLLESKKVKPATVAQWCTLVSQSQICKGMPADLVLLTWGRPKEERMNSDGEREWKWPRTHVTINGEGFVEFWSTKD